MASRAPSDPLGASDILALFAPLQSAGGVLLAVSGGVDSLALLLLAERWRAAAPAVPPIAVATVDHRLRPESAAEATMVARVCADRGFAHRTLSWDGEKPRAGLQEAAREARYRLLIAEARRLGASHLVTAHHRDDQAETVLMRLARGSGIGGLAAMRPLVQIAPDVVLTRPLLALPKDVLADVVRAEGLTPVDDPSNRDPRFERARMRRAVAARAILGLSDARLARLAERASRADAALEQIAAARYAALASSAGKDTLVLPRDLFADPEEVVLRVLRTAIANCAGETAPLRLERLETLVAGLVGARAKGLGVRRTLGGVIVSMDRDGGVSVRPEPPRRRGRTQKRNL